MSARTLEERVSALEHAQGASLREVTEILLAVCEHIEGQITDHPVPGVSRLRQIVDATGKPNGATARSIALRDQVRAGAQRIQERLARSGGSA